MKQHFSPARPAIAAIAAVIACPSTAALAQTVDAAPPVIVAPTAAEPAAPTPAQTAPATAPTPQVIFQPSTPVVQPTPAPSAPSVTATEEAPAARPATRNVREAAPTRTAPAERQAPIAEARPALTPQNTAAPAPAPVERTIAAPAPDAAPATAEPQTLPEEGGSDTALWLLGLGALGLIAGGAYAATRRRRGELGETADAGTALSPKGEFVAVDPAERLLTPEEKLGRDRVAPAPYVEPVYAKPEPAPIAVPVVMADHSASSMAERREAMAAAAPSAENPFRTRKNRLRRANFLLSREGGMDSPAPSRADDRAEVASTPHSTAEIRQVSYSFGSHGSLKPPVLKPRYN